MRILGLDVGDKTVGVAVSDPLGVIATGVTTIDRVGIRKDTGRVIDYIREYDCETVVIGLPLSLDGDDSIQTQKVRDFRTMLENKLRSSGPLSKVKIEWQDERYSTVEAEEVLIEAGMSREDRKKIIDRQAAIVILQRYLDSMPGEDTK
ncbi:MAG: Holliday junction resolvase RuvX [Clostridiales bacterium]|jgi:putative Holliday junction resolvase|nr:Holliday junction resolvase RuvX [Clostridiales bacterium]